MNIDQLAPILVQALLPHLDYIRGKITDSALSETGKVFVTFAKEKLFGKHEVAMKAMEDLVQNPGDSDNRQDFEIQVRNALKADPTLAAELSRLIQSAGIKLNVAGDSNKTAVVQGQNNTVNIN